MARTVNDMFKAEKIKWLEDARATARRLLKTQQYVTIEDVLKKNLYRSSSITILLAECSAR